MRFFRPFPLFLPPLLLRLRRILFFRTFFPTRTPSSSPPPAASTLRALAPAFLFRLCSCFCLCSCLCSCCCLCCCLSCCHSRRESASVFAVAFAVAFAFTSRQQSPLTPTPRPAGAPPRARASAACNADQRERHRAHARPLHAMFSAQLRSFPPVPTRPRFRTINADGAPVFAATPHGVSWHHATHASWREA